MAHVLEQHPTYAYSLKTLDTSLGIISVLIRVFYDNYYSTSRKEKINQNLVFTYDPVITVLLSPQDYS